MSEQHYLVGRRPAHLLYVALYGAVLGMGATLWLGRQFPPVVSALVCVGVAAVFGLFGWLTDRALRQVVILSTVAVVLPSSVALGITAELLGVPNLVLATAAGAGLLLGTCVGAIAVRRRRVGTLLGILGTLGAAGGALVYAWHTRPLTLDVLGAIAIGLAVPALLLSVGMPHKQMQRAIASSALLTILALAWFAPLLRLPAEAASSLLPPEILAATVLCGGALVGLLYLANFTRLLNGAWWPGDRLSARFYRFKLRPMENTEDAMHLEEMIREPDDLVTASHVTTWFYGRSTPGGKALGPLAGPGGQIDLRWLFAQLAPPVSDVVVSGHANHAVCREVSSKIFNTVLELDDSVIKRVIVVTGAGLIQVMEDKRKPPRDKNPAFKRERKKRRGADEALPTPLRGLQQDLGAMERVTGLVAANAASGRSYDEQVAAIRSQMQRALHEAGDKPTTFHPLLDKMPEAAVLLPFYRLSEPDLAPLQFELRRDQLGPEFESLVQDHSRALREGMIADAQRRLECYEEWKTRDVQQLRGLVGQMMATVTDNAPGTLPEEYYALVMSGDPIDTPILSLRRQISPDAFDKLDIVRQRTDRLAQFLAAHSTPGLSAQALRSIQAARYPIAGKRFFDDAREDSSGGISDYVSLQDLVEWHLPDMIGTDEDWIERMQEFLRKFDPDSPDYEGQRLDSINLAVFIDSFLRGWPPVFLEEEAVQERYNKWATAQRQKVWRQIHRQLRLRGISILPLQADSVIFHVQEKARILTITPHYMVTPSSLAAYLQPELGIPYYISHWEHRDRQVQPATGQANRIRAQELYALAQAGLAEGRIEAALDSLKQALRTHPTWTAETLLADGWAGLNADTQPLLDDRLELLEAIKVLDDDIDAAATKLEAFNRRYPFFVPEAYALLAFCRQARTTLLPALNARIAKLRQEAESCTDLLIREGAIHLDPETNNYQLDPHHAQVRTFIRRRSLRELAVRPEMVLDHAHAQLAEWQSRFPLGFGFQSGASDAGFWLTSPPGSSPTRPGLGSLGRWDPTTGNYPEWESLMPEGGVIRDPDGQLLTVACRVAQQMLGIVKEEGWPYRQRSDGIVIFLLGAHSPGDPLVAALTLEELVRAAGAEAKRQLRHIEKHEEPTHLERREALLAEVESLHEQHKALVARVWGALQQNATDPLRQAMMLDQQYVTQLLRAQNHGAVRSSTFHAHIQPLFEVPRAQACYQLGRELVDRIYNAPGKKRSLYQRLGDTAPEQGYHLPDVIDALKRTTSILKDIRGDSKLEARDLDRLDQAIKQLETYLQPDTLATKHIQGLLDRLASHYIGQAGHAFEQAQRVIEIGEVRRQFSLCSAHQGHYRAALASFLGSREAPPMSSMPGATFKLLKPEPVLLPDGADIQLDSQHRTIDLVFASGDRQSLIEYEGLNDSARDHLACELGRAGFLERLAGGGLPAAYALLLMPVARTVQGCAWYQLLEALEPWLLRVMAYTGVSFTRVEPEQHDKALAHFDRTSIVERVTMSPEDCERRAIEGLLSKS